MNKSKRMSMMQWWLCLVFSSMLTIFSPAVLSADVANSRSPEVIVKTAADDMIKKIEQAHSMPADKRHTFFYQMVSDVVGPMVDFELIAKRVMGKSYAAATAAERAEFTKVFRETLINTYAKGSSSYTDQKVTMKPFLGVKKVGTQEKAVVDTEIRGSDGTVLPVSYAFFKNDKGEWKLENMILNGVNLGLTFRNQFAEAIKAKGSIAKVIATWTVNPGGS
jgi:phospholipid transport system substrate-binding protein